MKPPIAVALITNELGEIFVGQRCDAGHDRREFELPGGRIEPREQPEHTIEREVWEETNSRVRILGRVGCLKFEDDGETREAELWNAEFLWGPDPYAREPEVHGSVGWRSLGELQGNDVHLSLVLRQVMDRMLAETLKPARSSNGQCTWHELPVSGIN